MSGAWSTDVDLLITLMRERPGGSYHTGEPLLWTEEPPVHFRGGRRVFSFPEEEDGCLDGGCSSLRLTLVVEPLGFGTIGFVEAGGYLRYLLNGR